MGVEVSGGGESASAEDPRPSDNWYHVEKSELGGEEKFRSAVATNDNATAQSTRAWLSKWKMPFTLENWRWGLQEALTISILMWPCCVPKIDQMFFNGNCRWVVASATPVIEGTAGGTTRRMIDRVAGTTIAGILVVIGLTITIGVHSERADSWYCVLALYIIMSLCGFVYNWLLFIIPTHPLIGITAAFMTPIILSGSVFTGNGVFYASWRSITVSFGVIVSGIISRYFLPRRARVDIIHGLADIMCHLAETLEPLVELESGLVANASFFQNDTHNVFDTSHFDEDGRDSQSGATPMEKVKVTAENWEEFKSNVWQKLELCGKLTNDQLVMVNAARTEVSMRKKNAFFQEEHREALMNIRTLFYHVASLFFLVETQIMGTSEFDDDDLLEEVQHWSKFGLLDLQVVSPTQHNSILRGNAGGGEHGAPTVGDAIREAERQSMMTVSSIARVSRLTETSEMPSAMGAAASCDNIAIGLRKQHQAATSPGTTNESKVPSSASTVLKMSCSAGLLSMEERMRADVNPTLKWVRLYGPTISLMVKHICRALRSTASGLRQNLFPIESEIAMKKAADAIALFHRQRAERQQATATFVEYAVHGKASWNLPDEDPHFLARFERMLGLSIAEYDSFSEAGRAVFWESYWLLRDRLSTSDTNVMTLFVAVRTTIAAVERLIQARRAKLSRGEDLHDNLDMEQVNLEQQVAIQKAGGITGFRGSIYNGETPAQ